jgi:hypothetical protein
MAGRFPPGFQYLIYLTLPLSAAEEQAAKTEQSEPGLAAKDVPQEARRFVAVDLSQGFARGIVQHVDQAAVIILAEMVQRAANEPVRREFTAESAQFATTFVEDRVGHTAGATEAGDDAADR